MSMTRRTFYKVLSGLPFVGCLSGKAPERTLYGIPVSEIASISKRQIRFVEGPTVVGFTFNRGCEKYKT